MNSLRLTPEELAGLIALDGTIGQRRPPVEIEIRLRELNLIHRDSISRLPVRTQTGENLVRECLGSAVREPEAPVLPSTRSLAKS